MHVPDHDVDEELETAGQEGTKYCNDWALEIHGGMEMANKIADKHGFINLGQVHRYSSNSYNNLIQECKLQHTVQLSYYWFIGWKFEKFLPFPTDD
jgi:hypothetical protein